MATTTYHGRVIFLLCYLDILFTNLVDKDHILPRPPLEPPTLSHPEANTDYDSFLTASQPIVPYSYYLQLTIEKIGNF